MTRRFLLVAVSFIIVCSSRAQFDSSFIKKNIRHCADSLTLAFRARNWDIFTRYSYPAVVGAMGGKKEFSDYIAMVFSQAPDSAWKKYETGNILQLVKKGGDFQAIIELNSVIEWQGMRITTTSHLVGESWDGGMFWTFFDSQGDRVAAKQIDPNLSEDLIIPKREEKRESLIRPKGNH
ncbi:MAG TPA: hypothetical protein VGO58_09615 [Chitinophagaceae bacterium]|jgi:hypothetical protein|nr:hypothetical protein [Chitinophagaceae bacterium]